MRDCIFDCEPTRFLPSARRFITMTGTKATNTKASGTEELPPCLRILKGQLSLSRWVSQVDLPLKTQWSAHISPNPSFYCIFTAPDRDLCVQSLCTSFQLQRKSATGNMVDYSKSGRLEPNVGLIGLKWRHQWGCILLWTFKVTLCSCLFAHIPCLLVPLHHFQSQYCRRG